MSTGRTNTRSRSGGESRRVDYLIVTALEHEREAVLGKLKARKLPKRAGDVYTYYEAWLPNERAEGAEYRIIVTSATTMGPLSAGALTSAALRRWQPDHLLLVGIAGGMPDEANVGDVVVPSFIASDIVGKYHEDDSRSVRWVPYEIDESLLDSAMNFRDGWQDLITVEPPEPVTTRRRATVVLSGGNVVASPKLAAEYAAAWDGKAGAIEMEAAGVAAATRGFRKRPAFFMIRGVSDPVNSQSNREIKERWRAYAADVAAAYAIGLIRSGPSVPIAARSAARRRGARRSAALSDSTGDRDGRPAFRSAPQTAEALEAMLATRFGITGREAESLVRLWSAFRAGRVTVVLGPDVASWSGIPSTADIVRRLQRATGIRTTDVAKLSATYAAQHSPETLRARVAEWLDDWNKPLTPIHQLLPLANARWVVSLTADRLAEEACRVLRRPFCVITFSEDLAYSRPDLLPIVKWNGTVDHPHTLTVGMADARPRAQRTKALVRRTMVDTDVVFVGCSPTDTDVREIAGTVVAMSDAPPVALVPRPSHRASWRRVGAAPVVAGSGSDDLRDVASVLGLVAGLAPDLLPRDFREMNRRRNPFRRLDPYRSGDAADFVGREQETRDVLQSLERLRAVVLFGSSGVGKSSFLQAGVIPTYDRAHPDAKATYEIVAPDLPERWASLLAGNAGTLLVLDQFERFFDAPLDDRRALFLRETLPTSLATKSGLRVVFSIRRDRIADLHPFRRAHSGLFTDSIELGSLSRRDAARVLTTSFGNAGYELAPVAADNIVAGTLLGGHPYLPSLQLHGHALFESVESLRLEGRLATNSVGSEHVTPLLQRDVVKRFVRDALLVFAGGERHAIVLQVLRRLTLHSRRQELPKRRLADDFPDPAAALAVLDLLVDQRLVRYVPERDAYELVHDTLVEAIEDGPLAIETDYSHADLVSFLTDAGRRARMPAAQALSVLRFSLRRRFAVVPWLQRLEELGVSGTAVLLELARDADADVASAAMDAMREHRPLLPLATQPGIRRHLLATVMAAFSEEEPREKGEAALRLLLALGLTEAELPALMDFIDPFRHADDPNDVETHQWTDADRALVLLALPDILVRAPAAELSRFGRYPFLQIENELGPVIYREILLGLAARGERKELRARYDAILDENSEAGNPDVVAWSLAHAPAAVADDESFDDVRRRMIDQYLFDPREELVGWLLRIMTQLAPRDPVTVMRAWLDGFARWAHNDDLWPVWRELASVVLPNREARALYFDYYAAASSVAESTKLGDVLLWLAPLRGFDARELPASERVRQVARSLDGTVIALGDLDALERAAGTLSTLDLWRAGLLLANAESSARERWDALVRLAQIVLRLRGNAAHDQDDAVEQAKAAFRDALAAFADDPSAAPTAVAIARALLVISPRLDCENTYWPPLGCPPEQWPAIEQLRALLEGSRSDSHAARVLAALDTWSAATPREPERLASVATWLLQKAAEIAASTGSAEYEAWFRELRGTADDWTLGLPPHGRSLFRWLFRRRDWTEEPWWALANDPRDGGGCDETEMEWLLETAAELEPREVVPLLRRWLAEVVHLNAGDVSGFANEARLGDALERLSISEWVRDLAAAFDEEKLQALLDDAMPSQVRAGLRIWAESNVASLLDSVARMMVSGPAALRPAVAAALDRWFSKTSL